MIRRYIFANIAFFLVVSCVSCNEAFACNKGKTVILNSSKPIEKQLKKKNTRYEVKEAFCVDGILSLPKGSVLSFNGGRFSGKGTILGNHSRIESDDTSILDGITLSGEWDNEHAYVSWFADGSEKTLSNAITLADTVFVDKDLTFSGNLITNKSGIVVIGNQHTFYEGVNGWTIQNASNVKVEGIRFWGTRQYVKGSTATALNIKDCSGVLVDGCTLDGCYFYGIVFNRCDKSQLKGCHFLQSGDVVRQMLAYAKHCDNMQIKGNDFTNIGLVYAIRIDYCTQSRIEGNRMINVKNNPILVNSGCSFCTVSENYIEGSDDTGIVCANDPVWFIDEGATHETIHAEPPHDILITNNIIRNMRDAGIGIYRDGSLNKDYSYNITIRDNVLEDNGLRSNADAYKNQIFLAARNVTVEGNTMRLSKANRAKHGVFIQSAYDAGQVYEVEGENIIIKNNTYQNLTPIGSNHNSTGGADPNIISNEGRKEEIDINLYSTGDGYLPKSKNGFAWSMPNGGYQSLLTLDEENHVITIRSTSGNTVSEIICTFKNNTYFKNTCIMTIEGEYKMDSPLREGENPSVTIVGTSASGVRKSLKSTMVYQHFNVSALLEKDIPSIQFMGTFATNKLYLKDVKIYVQELNGRL